MRPGETPFAVSLDNLMNCQEGPARPVANMVQTVPANLRTHSFKALPTEDAKRNLPGCAADT